MTMMQKNKLWSLMLNNENLLNTDELFQFPLLMEAEEFK